MADASLYYFCKYVLSFNLLELEPHWELCWFLEKNGHRDCMILLPRGTFKSTIVSVGYTLWRLTKNRDLRVLISSEKEDNAKGWLSQIKSIISSNTTFRGLYGAWDSEKQTGPWHTTAISISGRTRRTAQPSIVVSSVGSSETSQHYDMGIFDDIQTDSNIATREMIDSVEHYLQKQIPILDPQPETKLPGPRIVVGTRWGFDDVYGRIIAQDKQARREHRPESFRYLIRKAYTKTRVYFPERFPREILDHMRKTLNMSDYLFSCTYLNDPMPEGTEVFSLKDLGFYWTDKDGIGQRTIGREVSSMPQMINFFTTIDPSLGESYDSDYTAFVTVGVDASWNYYVWDVIRKHMDPNEIIETMFRVHKFNKPFRMGIEAVAFQKSLIYSFQKACRERGTWFHLDELKTDTLVSKDMRIRGFQPFVKGRKVFLKVSEKTSLTLSPTELIYYLVDGQDVLADEMIRFPLGATRDCVDALAYLPQLVFPAGEPPKAPVDPMSFEGLRKRIQRRDRSLLKVR